jgi:hypothetical protein
MAAIAPPRPAARRAAAAPGRLARLLADPRRVLVAAAALAALAACIDVLDDPDLFWHLRLGRWILDHRAVPHTELFSFTAQGSPLTAHEWGSEVIFALVVQVGGLLLLAVVMGLVAWSALIALGLRARQRGAGLAAVAVALLLGARAAEPVLGTRPQVFTVALLCWSLLIAERHLVRGGRLVWVLAPLMLVWANLHAGFVIGAGALTLVVACEAVRRCAGRPGAAPWRRIGSLAAATASGAALACLNPEGPGLFRYALATPMSERTKPITEWQPPNFADPANVGLLLLLASFVALVALGGRLTLRDTVLALVGFAAALTAVRNTSVAVALSLPAWTSLLQQVMTRVSLRRGVSRRSMGAALRRRPSLAALAVAVAVGGAAAGTVAARAAHDASSSGVAAVYPACAAGALRGVEGARVVAPYFVSGYLVEQLWPAGRLFVYGESASLGTAVFADYQRIYRGGADALGILAARGANAVLTGPGALHDSLSASAQWVRVLDDPSGVTLYVAPGLADVPYGTIAPSGECPTWLSKKACTWAMSRLCMPR